MSVQIDYVPDVLVDTADLSEEEWLGWRRTGIGGSDAAAVLGESPFATTRDLYYDKRGIVAVVDTEANWVAKEVGHLLEDLVAKIFSVKTGFRVYQMKKMFQHPLYPFMLADLDYFVELPDGATAILEIKTTNYNAKDKWWDGKREIVPRNYELQGRHYMAVMNIDMVYYCCLYGNNENEVIIRQIARDLEFESELIALEQHFWENHVQAEVPPPYTEDGDLVLESVYRHFGPADPSADAVVLGPEYAADILHYLDLQQQKSEWDRLSKLVEKDMSRIKGKIAAHMGKSCLATCAVEGAEYLVTFNPVRKPGVFKDNLTRLQAQLPEVYQQYVTVSESRRFAVKMLRADAEAAA